MQKEIITKIEELVLVHLLWSSKESFLPPIGFLISQSLKKNEMFEG